MANNDGFNFSIEGIIAIFSTLVASLAGMVIRLYERRIATLEEWKEKVAPTIADAQTKANATWRFVEDEIKKRFRSVGAGK